MIPRFFIETSLILTPSLNHVGQYAVLRAVQALYALNREQVGTNAVDMCSHSVEHAAKLLDVRFAGRIIYSCGATGKNSSHDNVGRSRDGSLVEEHVSSTQTVGENLVDITFGYMLELCTQSLEAQEMGV